MNRVLAERKQHAATRAHAPPMSRSPMNRSPTNHGPTGQADCVELRPRDQSCNQTPLWNCGEAAQSNVSSAMQEWEGAQTGSHETRLNETSGDVFGGSDPGWDDGRLYGKTSDALTRPYAPLRALAHPCTTLHNLAQSYLSYSGVPSSIANAPPCSSALLVRPARPPCSSALPYCPTALLPSCRAGIATGTAHTPWCHTLLPRGGWQGQATAHGVAVVSSHGAHSGPRLWTLLRLIRLLICMEVTLAHRGPTASYRRPLVKCRLRSVWYPRRASMTRHPGPRLDQPVW